MAVIWVKKRVLGETGMINFDTGARRGLVQICVHRREKDEMRRSTM